MKTMARTIMLMQRRWTSATSCTLLLLVVLALQLQDSSAVQDANEILIRPVADTQQQRHTEDVQAIAEEIVEEELEQLRLGTPYHISVSASGIITGTGGRTFHGTITGARGTVGQSTGTLLENGGLYNQTESFELTAPPNSGRVQTILFMNHAGITVGAWSGSFQPFILPATHGLGTFIRT